MASETFCPWCGKTLPEDMPCAAICPALFPRKVTWENRYHFWMAYSGVTLFSMIAWAVGIHFLGNFWGGFCIFVPPTAFALSMR